jgi:hypothetical protein
VHRPSYWQRTQRRQRPQFRGGLTGVSSATAVAVGVGGSRRSAGGTATGGGADRLDGWRTGTGWRYCAAAMRTVGLSGGAAADWQPATALPSRTAEYQ